MSLYVEEDDWCIKCPNCKEGINTADINSGYEDVECEECGSKYRLEVEYQKWFVITEIESKEKK